LQHWSVVVIEPTVGRIVWYRPSLNDSDSMAIHGGQPMAATVAFVVSNECVNLSRSPTTTAIPIRASQ
jgi:hypothetical protein